MYYDFTSKLDHSACSASAPRCLMKQNCIVQYIVSEADIFIELIEMETHFCLSLHGPVTSAGDVFILHLQCLSCGRMCTCIFCQHYL